MKLVAVTVDTNVAAPPDTIVKSVDELVPNSRFPDVRFLSDSVELPDAVNPKEP